VAEGSASVRASAMYLPCGWRPPRPRRTAGPFRISLARGGCTAAGCTRGPIDVDPNWGIGTEDCENATSVFCIS
jgi:hypothetical protein